MPEKKTVNSTDGIKTLSNSARQSRVTLTLHTSHIFKGATMRVLTLDEKITIKGLLAKKPGFSGMGIVNGTVKQYIQWFYWCYGKPLQYAFTRKMWHKGSIPNRYRKVTA
jgi:hypothetical protein